jgi:hypothetical protein
MEPVKDFICFKCKHKPVIGLGCAAFENIPKEIILSNKHDKVLPGQLAPLVFEKGTPEF